MICLTRSASTKEDLIEKIQDAVAGQDYVFLDINYTHAFDPSTGQSIYTVFILVTE